MGNRICTAIVTFNRLSLLRGAIGSLLSQVQPTDILVVNNGSTDGTKEFLDNRSDIHVIHQENVGGAGGFYTATKYIAEHNYTYAWIMDDDIIASQETLKNLYLAYKNLSKDEKIGFLCSKVISPEGFTVNVPSIDLSNNILGYPEWNKYIERGLVKVKSATFVSVFIPVKVIREVGLPIKEFFIWGDDTEYTKRISSRYACYQVGNSIIQHLRNGGSLSLKSFTDKNRIKMFKYYVRNNAYNEKVYGSKMSTALYFCVHLIQAIKFLFNGRPLKSKVIFQGLCSAIKFSPTIKYPE